MWEVTNTIANLLWGRLELNQHLSLVENRITIMLPPHLINTSYIHIPKYGDKHMLMLQCFKSSLTLTINDITLVVITSTGIFTPSNVVPLYLLNIFSNDVLIAEEVGLEPT